MRLRPARVSVWTRPLSETYSVCPRQSSPSGTVRPEAKARGRVLPRETDTTLPTSSET